MAAERRNRLIPDPAYFGFAESDRQILAELRPLIEKHSELIVDRFYEHLLSHEETRRFLRDPEVLRRLRIVQRDYLLELFGAPRDERYIERRKAIGVMHDRLRITPQWYIGAYASYTREIFPLLLDHYGKDTKRIVRAITAIDDAIRFDSAIVIETYIDLSQLALRRLNEELEDRIALRTDQFQESERRSRTIIENSPQGVIGYEADGTIQIWNPAAEKIYGYSKGEALGRIKFKLIDAKWNEESALRLAERVFSGEIVQQVEREDIDRLGRTVYTLSSHYPIRDHAGRIAMAIAVVIDVTERRRLQNQLRQSDRLATIGTLVSSIAHEVGTPLNVISGRAELLLSRLKLEEKDRLDLQTIIAQIERISSIIQNLLDFSRRKEPHRERVDMNDLAKAAIGFLEHRFQRASVSVSTDFLPDLSPFEGDPDQLQQVLINLAVNAIDAMPQGGVFRVATSRREATGKDGAAGIRLVVSDTGTGISESQIGSIFDPFFTTKGGGEGTGLGLSVAQGIVQGHRGTIRVSSKLGEGTTFVIDLPCEPAEVGEASKQRAPTGLR